MANEVEKRVNTRLYRLKIVDFHSTAFVVIGSKGDVGGAIDWLQHNVGDEWLKISGFDDEADRRPMTVIVARSAIAGMILTKV